MNTDYSKIDVELVAQKFVELLKNEIGSEKFSLVLASNREEVSPHVCHSHDFCDANMVMNEAFKASVGVDASEDINNETLLAKWSSAWDYAKNVLMPAETAGGEKVTDRGAHRG